MWQPWACKIQERASEEVKSVTVRLGPGQSWRARSMLQYNP